MEGEQPPERQSAFTSKYSIGGRCLKNDVSELAVNDNDDRTIASTRD